MIKFSKWMYELGYKSAIKDVLGAVDAIPNEKPHEAGIQARNEEQARRQMKSALIIFEVRKAFKDHMHQKFDPNYEPDLDLMIRDMDLL